MVLLLSGRGKEEGDDWIYLFLMYAEIKHLSRNSCFWYASSPRMDIPHCHPHYISTALKKTYALGASLSWIINILHRALQAHRLGKALFLAIDSDSVYEFLEQVCLFGLSSSGSCWQRHSTIGEIGFGEPV